MKNVFFKGQQVRITSIFEVKILHLGADLTLLSLNGEDWVMIASLCRKSNVKVGIKYVISPKQKTKKY